MSPKQVLILVVALLYIHTTNADRKRSGTCKTTFEGKEVEIEHGDTKWLNPCYFCWCYENSDEAGCNTVDCPVGTWRPCPDGTERVYLEGICCPQCLPKDQ